jgi:hypothetical protein
MSTQHSRMLTSKEGLKRQINTTTKPTSPPVITNIRRIDVGNWP